MKYDEGCSHQLHRDDARMVDFLVEHGFDPAAIEQLPEADRPRAHAVLRYFRVLDALPVAEPSESLTDAVLARVNRYDAEHEAAMRLQPQAPRRRHFRLADFVAVAAMIMLSAAVLLPIASQVRAKSLETACASNLRAVGLGVSSYANANRGQMPSMAGVGGSLFGDWGRYRNSDNLNVLSQQGYCPDHALNCPGCASGAGCYSYRVPVEGAQFILETPTRMVIAADANPVIQLRIDGRRARVGTLSSRNHAERGQNLLFSDFAVEWHGSPLLPDGAKPLMDNIWLPRGADGREELDLQRQPTVPSDNFVAQ